MGYENCLKTFFQMKIQVLEAKYYFFPQKVGLMQFSFRSKVLFFPSKSSFDAILALLHLETLN